MISLAVLPSSLLEFIEEAIFLVRTEGAEVIRGSGFVDFWSADKRSRFFDAFNFLRRSLMQAFKAARVSGHRLNSKYKQLRIIL